MIHHILAFEEEIHELESQVKALRSSLSYEECSEAESKEVAAQIEAIQSKITKERTKIYKSLTPWQTVQVARHPGRPYTQDYIDYMVSDFDTLHGDRLFSEDAAIIGGIGFIDFTPVMIIGHQKGRKVEDKVKHNFGMARPEGYRKAMRLMKMAEQFRLPIVTLVDTPGAYPGIDAEEHGQSAAIAECIQLMSSLTTPMISVVIGEGGSGGALALACADKVFMLEHSIYSVISPEGCAAILYKDVSKAEVAAQSMKITASDLLGLGLIDGTIKEPLGGAHRAFSEISERVKDTIVNTLEELSTIAPEQRYRNRYNRLLKIGL